MLARYLGIDYCALGSRFGLNLILNIEQYEYLSGPNSDVGVKVCVTAKFRIVWKTILFTLTFSYFQNDGRLCIIICYTYTTSVKITQDPALNVFDESSSSRHYKI